MKIRIPQLIFFIFLLAFSSVFKVNAQVIANFTYTLTPANGCAPGSVKFTNTSTGAASYSWNFGNGNTSTITSPGATYNAPNTYTVVLTATNGGSSNTHTATISVFGIPTPSFTMSAMPACVGQDVTFTDQSIPGSGTIATWDWDFGDGTNLNTLTGSATHAYVTAGTFPVTLIVTNSNGCSKNIINNVTISPGPLAKFTATPLSSCTPPVKVDFTNTSTSVGAVSYLWNFGDGNTSNLKNPSNTFTFTGSFPVSLEVIQPGCKDTLTLQNYVVIQDITPDFVVDDPSLCVGQTATFTDLSAPLSVTRTWNFGDGKTSTLANPTHVYATAGTYTVSLLNATANGCTNSIIKKDYITVIPSPIASFAANQTKSCITPFSVKFTDSSVGAVDWDWDFGDSTKSNSKNPTHIYADSGAHTVTLVVTNSDGCKTTLVKPNYIIISAPVADFTATPYEGCIPLKVNFIDTVTTPFDPIVNYKWDFGNGTGNSALPTISRTYGAIGTYTVSLIVTTALGCKDTVTKANYVKAGIPPKAKFSVVDSVVCYETMAKFTDQSIGADSAHWEFNGTEGVFDTPANAAMPYNPVTYNFQQIGTFPVMEIAFSNGCPDTFLINKAVKVIPPVPVFTHTLNCLNPYSVDFTNISQLADSTVWNFLDGSPLISNTSTLTHVFAAKGQQIITISAWNFKTGCSNKFKDTITIADPKAKLSASPIIGCYPLKVNFKNLSIDADSVTWDFGDNTPTSSDTTSFNHTYTLPDKYTAKLNIIDVNGCMDSTKTTITAQGPKPNFKSNKTDGCAPLAVIFNDLTSSDSTIVKWTWDFGDGTPNKTSVSKTMNHTYTTPGSYTVKMTVEDKNGCSNTATKSHYIEPTFPTPGFVVDSFACKKEGVFFDASTTVVEDPSNYDWDFGDGTTDTGMFPTHFYLSDNLYNVKLTVTDKNNCASSIQHPIRIQGPKAAFTYSVISQGCGVSNIQFTDLSAGLNIIDWKWNFGDGASSQQQDPNPIHVYTQPGFFPVTLVVSNAAGCVDTFLLDSLLVLGPIGSYSFTPDRGCVPLTVTFTAVSSNSTHYIWDFGDGAILDTISPIVQHIYTQVDTATPFLLLGNVLPDGSPCQFPAPPAGSITVTTSMIVTIDSVLNVPCNGDSVGSIFSSVIGGTLPYTYSWSTNPVQTISSISNLFAGTYTLTVTDSNQCVTPAIATVTEPLPIVTTAGINDTVCPGTPAVLTATASGGSGGYYYVWQPTGNINGGTFNLTPTTDSILTVTGYDVNNCKGTSVTTSVIVYTLNLNSVNATATSPICPGQSTNIAVQTTGNTGPLTYLWDHNLGTGPGTYTQIPLVSTTYAVTVSNICGTSVTDSAAVVFNPPPTVILTSSTNSICAPDIVLFIDSSTTGNPSDPIISWNWVFDDGGTSIQQNPNHTFAVPRAYFVNLTVTTQGGCTNNASATPLIINAFSYPIANFSVSSTNLDLPYETTVCKNQSSGASTYRWDFGDGFTSTDINPSHLYTKVGIFQIQLIATSQNGCSDTTYVEVTTSADVVFPNVFTPNSKNPSGGAYDMSNLDNDVFFPYTAGVVDYKFQIYNRWGELIFESLDIKTGWDGYYKGKLCQQDVYVWKAYVRLNNGKVFDKSGDVTLLR